MINNLLETNDTPLNDLSGNSNELGAELRHLREQKGLTIKEVADRLKLPTRQIEALENGLYDGLPEPVFIRGFLRSYGRFLDMDETRLSGYLDRIAPPSTKPRSSETQHDLNFANSAVKKSAPKWIWGVVAVAIIGAGVYFWQAKSNAENEAQENVSTIPVDNQEVAPPNLNADNMIVRPMNPSDTATETAVASTVMQQNNQTLTQTPSTPVAPVTAVAGELVISNKHRTMLTVTDVHGKVLLNKIVPAASEHRFKEGAPFEVRMGYAEGATATFAGQPIDLNAQQKEGQSVAFTAGAAPKP